MRAPRRMQTRGMTKSGPRSGLHRSAIQKSGGYGGRPSRFEVRPRKGGITMHIQRLIVYVFAASLVSLMAGSAMADVGSGNFNAFLHGKYQLSANVTCSTGSTVESIGADPTSFITFAGVITYDGHGHATVTDQGVVIGTGSPDKFDEACEYSYEVARDGSFSQKGSCTGVGGSYFLSGIKERGQIGVGGSVLITNVIGTDVETLVAPAPPAVPTFTQYRICGSVGTAVRINPQ